VRYVATETRAESPDDVDTATGPGAAAGTGGATGSDGPTEAGDPTGSETAVTGAQSSDPAPNRQLLDVLPEDERSILEPVVKSPGLTQIKVRDRSGFSRSKVSQTVTDLEERGLLYRERQGRTYRVYPAEDLDERL
jgi:uncharacterized membrane protein